MIVENKRWVTWEGYVRETKGRLSRMKKYEYFEMNAGKTQSRLYVCVMQVDECVCENIRSTKSLDLK